jgi:hypothetical protein
MSLSRKCESCGHRFKSTWTDEEAEAEFTKNFGYPSREATDTSVVCDRCYDHLLTGNALIQSRDAIKEALKMINGYEMRNLEQVLNRGLGK